MHHIIEDGSRGPTSGRSATIATSPALRVAVFNLFTFLSIFSLITPRPTSAQVDTVWIRYHNGGYRSGVGRFLALDGAGNVYVAGESEGPDSTFDYATLKYSVSGDLLWIRRWASPKRVKDQPSAVGVDRQGNVFVTGTSDTAGLEDYITVKYNAAGVEQWVARYNGPADSTDIAVGLDVDSAGNCYVTGMSEELGLWGYMDFATIKYNPAGETIWVRRHANPGPSTEGAYAIAVDDSQNVFVAGFASEATSNADFFTIKYGPDGSVRWTARHDHDLNEGAHAMALDGAGNVYVTGFSYDPQFAEDYLTVKYDARGETLWTRRYSGPGQQFDFVDAIAIDQNGCALITGRSPDTSGHYDFATVKYDPSGNQVWVDRYRKPGRSSSAAYAIAVDRAGSAYVAGQSSNWIDTSCVTVVKYTPDGTREWVLNDTLAGAAYAVAVDSAGYFYVVGGKRSDFFTAKYRQVLLVNQAGSCRREERSPAMTPNPFSQVLTMRFPAVLDHRDRVRISIYDAVGRLVRILGFDSPHGAGPAIVRWDARDAAGQLVRDGVYFVVLLVGDESLVRKVVRLSH